MLLKMKVPSPGESISEVEIAEWMVEDGDYVEKDETIAEIDSDKATLELPAEESGVIQILVGNGETVSVGDVVCIIDTSVKNPNSKVKKKKQTLNNIQNRSRKEEEVHQSPIQKATKSTPLASSIISKNDITANNLSGSGNSGKIMKDDVLSILNKENIYEEGRIIKKSKLSSLRRKIATRLVSVKNETAMLTTFNEIDMSAIFDIRKKFKEDFKDKHKVGLGFMSFFTKAVTESLKDFKDVNSMIDGEYILHHDYSDIGIAVSAPKGLMVPVIRNAELMSFKQIELEIKELATKAREGKITLQEMSGGTFTITNGGVFGSMLSTPIINPPQSAILGMHNILERAVVIEGQITIRPIMYVALSYDHRIIDGRESVGFLCKVKECIENPKELLMNNNIKKSLDL